MMEGRDVSTFGLAMSTQLIDGFKCKVHEHFVPLKV